MTVSSSSSSTTTASGGTSFALTVGAIGVVYGDIGTSPLYAFREAMLAVSSGSVPQLAEVLGVLSMIFWALMIIVTLKYVIILLNIDNHGEGGPLALMALVRSAFYGGSLPILFIGMAATALFFGDSIITPAISVLSAVEGLKVVSPTFSTWVLPLTVVIIVVLYAAQSHGTGKISTLFGPITALWFIVLALTGLQHIDAHPEVLLALNPWYALKFIVAHKAVAFVALGAVFLAVTGAEALYADLGHFGKSPIRQAWAWLVLPSLMLNYMGQGALVLADPTAMDNPFFKLVTPAQQIPLVLLATAATIIASQAVITGAFSLTRQAVNLGLLPRLVVKHTSEQHLGQIYMPQVNYLMMIGVLILVATFKSSGALASAYGISVSGTMLLTAIMVFFVLWRLREWHPVAAFAATLPLVLLDGVFLSSNMLKVHNGGWVPLMLAVVLMLLMGTWIRGTIILNSRALKRNIRMEKFVRVFREKFGTPPRVPGTAFFMSSDPRYVPASLLQNLKHNHILHEKNVILSIKIEQVPYVDPSQRSIVSAMNEDFSVLVMRFGFKEAPNVQEELIRLNNDEHAPLSFDWEQTSLFLNRRVLRSYPGYGLPLFFDRIYIWLDKNAGDSSDYYRLPMGRVIEIGRHVII